MSAVEWIEGVGVAVACIGLAVTAWQGHSAREEARSAMYEARRAADALESIRTVLDRMATGEAAEAPRDFFEFEWRDHNTLALRNTSGELLTHVSVYAPPQMEGLIRKAPDCITLQNLQSHPMFLLEAWGLSTPGELEVECDQLPDVVFVPVPPRPAHPAGGASNLRP